MCGIIGISGINVDPKIRHAIEAGLVTLTYRGPDGGGIIQLPNTIFGHRRLSIIDLQGGAQPMEDNTGNFVITFNGEIYNYKELREKLEGTGHLFKTQSDTEVILEAYREYGYDCVNHLDGMFAFAIWDKKNQELFLARDRFGEKPLFYSQLDNGLLFSSEIKGIIATGLVDQKLDLVSLDNYLALSYIPPWRSVYVSIKPLPPAHYAVFKNGIFTKTHYWKLRRTNLNVSFDEAVDTVREMFEKSVKSRMIADVEVGTFLSGGIDSSIITALAQKASITSKIKTFSAGFEDFINELPYAEQIAKKYNTEHYSINIKTDLVKVLKEVSVYFDEPFADSSNIPTHLLSEFSQKYVSVVLSGDGGDELFFGYGHYRSHWYTSLLRKLINSFREVMFGYQPKHLMLFFSSASERRKLWKNSTAVEDNLVSYLDLEEAKTTLQKINLTDFLMTIPGEILTKVDRSSMMHSLEVRSPFLNHELAEFVYNLPDEYKTNHNQGKLILAQAFKNLIPPEFFTRKKQGFGAPIKQWLRKKELRPLLDSLVQPEAKINALLKTERVRLILEEFNAGNDQLARRVWVLLTLELWLQAHPESHI